VNYIIHKGDSKEQGGKDMKFSGKENKEIWVNSGDRKIYFTLEEAKKGREEKPCQ
jgi:antibiotic biosynthesis monooxygenase (ABM) superfamily enzyme